MASEFTSKTMDLTHLTTKHEIESSTMDISTTEHWMIIWICVGAVRVYTMSYNQLFIIHHYILQLEFNIYIYVNFCADATPRSLAVFLSKKTRLENSTSWRSSNFCPRLRTMRTTSWLQDPGIGNWLRGVTRKHSPKLRRCQDFRPQGEPKEKKTGKNNWTVPETSETWILSAFERPEYWLVHL